MIIDTHIHRGPIAGQAVMDHSLGRIVNTMDTLGIHISISCNTMSMFLKDFEGGAKLACKEYEQSRGRVCSYLYYHPKLVEESLRVIGDYRGEDAFRGVKIHPTETNVYGDDELFRPIWELAALHDLPIISHTWDVSSYNPGQKFSYPGRFEKYLKSYPSVRFIMAHSGGRYHAIIEAARLGMEYPNVFYDTAGDIHANGYLEYLIEQVGASRVFYGSDCPMMDQRTMLGVVLGADISLEDKERILFKNANDFFGLDL